MCRVLFLEVVCLLQHVLSEGIGPDADSVLRAVDVLS